MPEVVYPSELERKILRLEAPGGPPDSVDVVIPTITRPGEPFSVKLAVLDGDGYPSVECGDELELLGPDGKTGLGMLRFEKGQPAAARFEGVSVDSAGLFRLAARLGEASFVSNPSLATGDPRPGVYWGDPHVHTVLSNCHADRCRSLDFCYAAARHVTGLDFVSAADHVSNGRSSFGQWRQQVASGERYDDPPVFATLPAYEASLKGGAGGDNNVYMLNWPPMFVDEFEEGDTRTICDKLAEHLPRDQFFVVPHHTTRTGKHGEIGVDIYPGPDAMPVVEIHSKWGTSEYRGNPNALLKIHPGPSYVADLLSSGLPLGFIAGTDTHATMPSGRGGDAAHIPGLPGFTAVFADELKRDNVFAGIRKRSCYGASGERIYLDVAIAGRRMGEQGTWPGGGDPRRISATVAAKSAIVSIDVVRNGSTVHSVAPGDWRGEFEFDDAEDLSGLWMESPVIGRFVYYYVRVTCESGAQAWSSPVWLTSA